jgi:hypothetical protein
MLGRYTTGPVLLERAVVYHEGIPMSIHIVNFVSAK